MTSVPLAAELIHLGMDTSVNKIVVAVLRPGEEIPVVERIPGDEESVRRLVGRFPGRRLLSACYEAGPGGYELYRLLASMGVACEVVAPSLVPKGGSDRVKTDRRDSVRLVLPHRAGLLAPVRVPSPAEEAVRDLVRARGDLLDDRKRMQQRLNAMLLRHGRVWRGGAKWTYVRGRRHRGGPRAGRLRVGGDDQLTPLPGRGRRPGRKPVVYRDARRGRK
jgi:transposase